MHPFHLSPMQNTLNTNMDSQYVHNLITYFGAKASCKKTQFNYNRPLQDAIYQRS